MATFHAEASAKKKVHYYREDKVNGRISEVSREEMLAQTRAPFKDPQAAIDRSSKRYPLNSMYAWYWKEEEA